jgi:2-polyprenyl-3-methyl-5-hydroxy-6-metoxy-1,4-benzoquinol methylase
MHLSTLKKHWTEFGKQDPLWAILTHGGKKGGKWDVEEFFEIGRRDVDAWLGAALAEKPGIGRARALDFGCGVGRLTQALAEHFNSVVGVDIAPTMIEEALKYNRHGDRCKYHVNDRPDLQQFLDGEFDFILTLIVLQHMAPHYAKGYLKEFLRLLKPGGVVLFQMPEVSLTPENRIIPEDAEPIMDMFGIPPNEIISFIEDNGGRILNVHYNLSPGAEKSHIYIAEKLPVVTH